MGQNIADVANILTAARQGQSVALTITASQGDGTTCTIKKLSGGKINAVLSCTSGDATVTASAGIVRVGGATVQFFPFGFGDVICYIVLNPTTAAVTLGSYGPIPSNGLGWTCTTNIQPAGTQTPIVAGSVSWP